jgi:septal ring-binding cell division protein DamX
MFRLFADEKMNGYSTIHNHWKNEGGFLPMTWARLQLSLVVGAALGLIMAGYASAKEPSELSATAVKQPLQQRTSVGGVEWIGRQPATSYTLQLMAASSPVTLVQLIKERALSAPLAIAKSKDGEGALYLLFQGSYANRSDAQGEAAQIESTTGLRPWIRRFASLTAIRDASTDTFFQKNRQSAAVTGAAWLWSRNPVHYTVQLMSDNQIETLRTFVARERPAGPLAIVRVNLKGKAWYLLLAGDHASEEKATQAILALPEEVSGAGPWPRSFASLQEQMAAVNQ